VVSNRVARGGSLSPVAQSGLGGGGARIAGALRRYTLSGLIRGSWVRRRFTKAGIVACRGGRPLPFVQNRGRLTAENIGLWSGVRLEVGQQGHLSIGKGTYLNRNVTVVCDERVDIGRDCAISWDVVIMDTDQHERDGMGATTAQVRIEDGVWIGCRAIVLKGVTIGRGAVIGAGAIVTRDIPPYSVAVGQPARVVRTLPSPTSAGSSEATVRGPQ
jgi:acetyltransferase-like isoleucine patch superfamily enzyme